MVPRRQAQDSYHRISKPIPVRLVLDSLAARRWSLVEIMVKALGNIVDT